MAKGALDKPRGGLAGLYVLQLVFRGPSSAGYRGGWPGGG
jgi:hypothetical protein